MDFALSEEQQAVRDLATQIIGEQATPERLKAVEATDGEGGIFDAELWSALADAGLLGIAIAEEFGGAGLDFVSADALHRLRCPRPPDHRVGRSQER